MNVPAGSIQVATPLSAQLTIHQNIAQDVIVVSEDKLRLCLQRHEKRLSASGDWITPLGLLLTLLATLISADFKKVVLPADTWETVFWVLALISAYRVCLAMWTKVKNRNCETVDSIVKELKSAATP
jgi:phosphoglycerol transferase MdoB-like AlkP superfamily enzyme